jgi:hypothetical protein
MTWMLPVSGLLFHKLPPTLFYTIGFFYPDHLWVPKARKALDQLGRRSKLRESIYAC